MVNFGWYKLHLKYDNEPDPLVIEIKEIEEGLDAELEDPGTLAIYCPVKQDSEKLFSVSAHGEYEFSTNCFIGTFSKEAIDEILQLSEKEKQQIRLSPL